MKELSFIPLTIGIAACVPLVIGLFRPWIALWWRAYQNRRSVIKLYGPIAIICFFLYWLLIQTGS